MILALKVHDRDNVATLFADAVRAGSEVEVRDKEGRKDHLTVHADIPYGHKVALADIPKGAEIYKYGESIGAASVDIRRGDYVHVHNLESLRARGDLEGGSR